MNVLRARLQRLIGPITELAVEGRRARFELVRVLSAAPEELWPWLTEDARIARWSSAAVELRGPFARGSERVVRLRLGSLAVFTLRETLTRVDPPYLIAYRGHSIREHEGSVRLEALGGAGRADETRLTWCASFRAPAAPLARPMAMFVQCQLGASLDRLARLLAPTPP